MFGIRYMKASPTTYVLHYVNGAIKHQGTGVAFFYFAPTATMVAIPVDSADIPFVFSETTSDFQPITVQGQLTYRVDDAEKLSTLLDFSIPHGDGLDVLKQRLINVLQAVTRSVVSKLPLREVLVRSEAIGSRVIQDLQASEAMARLGAEVLDLSIMSVRATPEMSRALEAESREALQREADEAIYSRRNAAVEQERRIKENELNTEIAVEEKQRIIRETQMAAEIAVEEQRSLLIERKIENDRKETDSRVYALETTLKPLKEIDWRTLTAAGLGGTDPRMNIALAFREMAENAQKIGEINVSPDLLKSLLAGK
ncbi:MAG: SPFH domain-containing protein [Candidatus Xenobia bacterium]